MTAWGVLLSALAIYPMSVAAIAALTWGHRPHMSPAAWLTQALAWPVVLAWLWAAEIRTTLNDRARAVIPGAEDYDDGDDPTPGA